VKANALRKPDLLGRFFDSRRFSENSRAGVFHGRDGRAPFDLERKWETGNRKQRRIRA